MGYTPLAPFRGPVDDATLRHRSDPRPAPAGIDKWAVLHELRAARTRLGLSDRTLTVLQALLTFHKGDRLGESPAGHVVHASNAAIGERLNGMPESTLRRHVATLVKAGLVARRDSPNGKRYVRRYADSADAYGLDLAPLSRRFDEICREAQLARAETDATRRMRHDASLMLRDLLAFITHGRTVAPALLLWNDVHDAALLMARELRRKLSADVLRDRITTLETTLGACRTALDSDEVSVSDDRNERHIQESERKNFEESRKVITRGVFAGNEVELSAGDEISVDQEPRREAATVEKVLVTCREIQSYAAQPIRTWDDLIGLAEQIRPMVGIGSRVWQEATRTVGRANAAGVLASMMERLATIRSPGAYFRVMVRKLAAGSGRDVAGSQV
ncbi:plasmid replication protein RepC [uncultured Jannaschia sp.]|uniref:plasmid replication protein RepC n=1 Tax=uncultured Jannaschia sp. TaxID=293347 RepID=UPI002618AE47|nr:plasmid replication protein RepC [uncultured Jannaschia sp.]